MRIELENAEDPGGRFSQTYEDGELAFDESELRLIEPVRVTGQSRRDAGQVEIRGELHTKVALPCGRCLKEVQLPIDVEFVERFAGSVSWRHEEQHELSREDLDLGLVDGAADRGSGRIPCGVRGTARSRWCVWPASSCGRSSLPVPR